MMRSRLGVLAIFGLSAVACGTTSSRLETTTSPAAPNVPQTTTTAPPQNADAPAGTVEDPPETAASSAATTLTRCADIAMASTAVLTDPPVGGNVDDVFLGVLQTYASEHPETFGGLWIDREAFGTVVLAFTDDPAQHLEELNRRAPSIDDLSVTDPPPEITDERPISEWDLSFDVVRSDYSEQVLLEASGPVFDAANSWSTQVAGGSVDIRRSRVAIDLAAPATSTELADLAEAVDSLDGVSLDMVCWNGQLASEAPAPIEPGAPLDVVAVPGPDGRLAPETRVGCDAIGEFQLGDLDELTPVASVDPGLKSVLDGWLANGEGQFWPQDGWELLFERDGLATFVRVAEAGVTTVHAESGANGWIWAGASGGGPCDVMVALPQGLGAVAWTLDASAGAPDPSSAQISVLATERGCSGGSEMGDRLLGPQVVETDESVGIVFAVIPLVGAQPCPGNPSAPVTIDLDAPLGDRQILDALAIAPLQSLIGD